MTGAEWLLAQAAMFNSAGHKERELQRTAERVAEINDEQGLYFAIAFLYDSQCGREDIRRILEIMLENRNKLCFKGDISCGQ